MPIPKPKGKEKESDYISRCMEFLDSENSSLTQKQRVAACYSRFREVKKEEEDNSLNLKAGGAYPQKVFNRDYPEIPPLDENTPKLKRYIEVLEDELRNPEKE
jgi:hypothetical protein